MENHGAKNVHDVDVGFGYWFIQSFQCAKVVLESSYGKSVRNLYQPHDFGESSPFPILPGHQRSNTETARSTPTHQEQLYQAIRLRLTSLSRRKRLR